MTLPRKKRKQVFVPEEFFEKRYYGDLYGTRHEEAGVFNIYSEDIRRVYGDSAERIGLIVPAGVQDVPDGLLVGRWDGGSIDFTYNDETYAVKNYNLVQNIFSRNTGILESSMMKDKCAFILGCGSVGSLIALELARAGVGKFVLIDNDILEYHNLCRHQCSIADVGDYKVYSVGRRIREINPTAEVVTANRIVEEVSRGVFDMHCKPGSAIIVGCADNRAADVYANSVAITYGVPFLSVGFWERAFAGEIFYHLPGHDMPCYQCALGDGGGLSQRQSTNRRFYTTQEDLANASFEPGISIDINFVTTIGIKLILDILNIGNEGYTPRLLGDLAQYTLVCNTNNPKIGGEMAEIFSYPLQVTTSLRVHYQKPCPPCEHLPKA